MPSIQTSKLREALFKSLLVGTFLSIYSFSTTKPSLSSKDSSLSDSSCSLNIWTITLSRKYLSFSTVGLLSIYSTSWEGGTVSYITIGNDSFGILFNNPCSHLLQYYTEILYKQMFLPSALLSAFSMISAYVDENGM